MEAGEIVPLRPVLAIGQLNVNGLVYWDSRISELYRKGFESSYDIYLKCQKHCIHGSSWEKS